MLVPSGNRSEHFSSNIKIVPITGMPSSIDVNGHSCYNIHTESVWNPRNARSLVVVNIGERKWQTALHLARPRD